MSEPKAVLITGSNSGFGRLTAELLASEGHQVFATMRAVDTRNARAAGELAAVPGITVLEIDVTSEDSVNAAVAAAAAQSGKIDCVINNAGVGSFGITEAFTPERWQTIFDTNLFGCIRVNRAALPHMRRMRKGLLVHISSIAGRLPAAYLGPYCASKWALEAYAEMLRLELAPLGIDSVIVEPGKYRTEIFTKFINPDEPDRSAEYGSADLTGRFMEAYIADMDRLAQDPVQVALSIRDLIGMPEAERPFRTGVGQDTGGLAPYNSLADHLRERVADAFRLPEMLPYRTAGSSIKVPRCET